VNAAESAVARAAALSAVLAAAGAALGLGRDVVVSFFFGANRATDAFFVAWTVPETTAPLLIEGTMAFVMVPAFGRALAAAQARRGAAGVSGGGVTATADPTRELVEATFVRILVGLGAVAVLVAAVAPWLVAVLVPGLPDPELAVRCLRAVAVTIPLFGVAGYLAAALRTHGSFGPPAALTLAYNAGIIVTILLTHRWLGVLGAATGIAVGAALMVAVQLPAALRRVPLPHTLSLRRSTTLLAFAAFLPVAAHSLARQAQVFVERFAAAPPDWFGVRLAEGTISHLNYSQKIGQIPITLSFMAAAVTFPIFARSVASGSLELARRRMETDTAVLGGIALLVTGYLLIYAPEVVQVLFQRGEFSPQDTAATAAILRVYVLGITGQALVSLLVRPFFTYESRVWFPARAMLYGLLVTVVAAFALVGPFGGPGIAGANALGITVTAVILAAGARTRLSTAPTAAAYRRTALLAVPVGVAALVGLGLKHLLATTPAIVSGTVGGIAMLAVVGAAVAVALRRARRRGLPGPGGS